MDLRDFNRTNGYVTIPNPDYNPRSKKNKKPKYIEVKDLGPWGENVFAGTLAKNINDRFAIDSEVADKYSKYGISYNKVQNLDLQLFEAQPMLDKAWNSFLQTVWNETAVGITKGFFDLADFMYNGLVNQQIGGTDYTNPISRALEQYQEEFKTNHPIYEDPTKDIYTGSLLSMSYYLNRAPSIATTLSLLIPGFGLSKGVSYLGKVSQASKLIGNTRKLFTGFKSVEKALNSGRKLEELNTLQRISSTLNNQQGLVRIANQGFELSINAGVQRVMENYQEARQTYSEMLPESTRILKEMSDEDYAEFLKYNEDAIKDVKDKENRAEVAKAVAKAAADRTFKDDMWLGLVDFAQLVALRNMTGAFNGLSRASVRRAQINSMKYKGLTGDALKAELAKRPLYIKAKDKLSDYFYGSKWAIASQLNEGVEEAWNFVAQQEGITYGHALLENEPFTSVWDDRLRDYLRNPNLWDSALWGVIGGVAFHAVGSKLNQISNAIDVTKEERKRKKEYDPKGEQQENIRETNWWKRFILPEVKSRLDNIENRTIRMMNLREQLKKVDDGIDPFTGVQLKNDGEKQAVRERLFAQEETSIMLDAALVGNFDLSVEFLSSDAWIDYLTENTQVSKEDMLARREKLLQKASKIKKLYNYEMLAMGNALRGKDEYLGIDYSKTPLEVLQLIVAENISHQLAADAIDEIASKYNIIENTEEKRIEEALKDQGIDYKEAVRTFGIGQQLGLIDAEIEAIEKGLGKEKGSRFSDVRTINGQYTLEKLRKRKETLLKLLDTNKGLTIDEKLSKGEQIIEFRNKRLTRMLNALKLSSAIVMEQTGPKSVPNEILNKRFNDLDKIITNAYESTEEDWGKHKLELSKLHKDFGKLTLDEFRFIKDSADIQDRDYGIALRPASAENEIKGLADYSELLLDAYANLAALEMEKAVELSNVVHDREGILAQTLAITRSINKIMPKLENIAMNTLKGIAKAHADITPDMIAGDFSTALAYGTIDENSRNIIKNILSEEELRKYDDAMRILAYNNEKVTGEKGNTKIQNALLPRFVARALWESGIDKYSDFVVEPVEEPQQEEQQRQEQEDKKDDNNVNNITQLDENKLYDIKIDNGQITFIETNNNRIGLNIISLGNNQYELDLISKGDDITALTFYQLHGSYFLENSEDLIEIDSKVISNPKIEIVPLTKDKFRVYEKGKVGKGQPVQGGGTQGGTQNRSQDDDSFDDTILKRQQQGQGSQGQGGTTQLTEAQKAEIDECLTQFDNKEILIEWLAHYENFEGVSKETIKEYVDEKTGEEASTAINENQSNSTIFDDDGTINGIILNNLVKEFFDRTAPVYEEFNGQIRRVINPETFIRFLRTKSDNDIVIERLYDACINKLTRDYDVTDKQIIKEEILEKSKHSYDSIRDVNGRTLALEYRLRKLTDETSIKQWHKAFKSLNLGSKLKVIRNRDDYGNILGIDFSVNVDGNEVIIGGIAVPYKQTTDNGFLNVRERGWVYDVPTNPTEEGEVQKLFRDLLIEKEDKSNTPLIHLIVKNLRIIRYEKDTKEFTNEYKAFAKTVFDEIVRISGKENIAKHLVKPIDNLTDEDVANLVDHIAQIYNGISPYANRVILPKGDEQHIKSIQKIAADSINDWFEKIRQGSLLGRELSTGEHKDVEEVEVDTINEGTLITTLQEQASIPSIAITNKDAILDIAVVEERGTVLTTNEDVGRKINNNNLKKGSTFVTIRRKDGTFSYVHAFPLRAVDVRNMKPNSKYGKLYDATLNYIKSEINEWLNDSNRSISELKNFLAAICSSQGNALFRNIRINQIKNGNVNALEVVFSYDDEPHYIYFFDSKKDGSKTSVIDLGKEYDPVENAYFNKRVTKDNKEKLNELFSHFEKALDFNIAFNLVKGINVNNGIITSNNTDGFVIKIKKNADKSSNDYYKFKWNSYKDFMLGNNDVAPIKITTKPHRISGSNFISPTDYGYSEQEKPRVTYKVPETVLPIDEGTSENSLEKEIKDIISKGDKDVGKTLITKLLKDTPLERLQKSSLLTKLDWSRIKYIPNAGENVIAAHYEQDTDINGVHINAGDIVVTDIWFNKLINRNLTDEAFRNLLHEVIHRYIFSIPENLKEIWFNEIRDNVILPFRRYVMENKDSDMYDYLFLKEQPNGSLIESSEHYKNGELNDTGIEEFLVESITRPKLIKTLNNIDKDGKILKDGQPTVFDKVKSLFQEILKVICEMFGINVKNESLLQNEYEIISNFVNENKENNNTNETNSSENNNQPKENKSRNRRLSRKDMDDDDDIVKRASTILDENVSYNRLEQAVPTEYIKNFRMLRDKGIIRIIC